MFHFYWLLVRLMVLLLLLLLDECAAHRIWIINICCVNIVLCSIYSTSAIDFSHYKMQQTHTHDALATKQGENQQIFKLQCEHKKIKLKKKLLPQYTECLFRTNVIVFFSSLFCLKSKKLYWKTSWKSLQNAHLLSLSDDCDLID